MKDTLLLLILCLMKTWLYLLQNVESKFHPDEDQQSGASPRLGNDLEKFVRLSEDAEGVEGVIAVWFTMEISTFSAV